MAEINLPYSAASALSSTPTRCVWKLTLGRQSAMPTKRAFTGPFTSPTPAKNFSAYTPHLQHDEVIVSKQCYKVGLTQGIKPAGCVEPARQTHHMDPSSPSMDASDGSQNIESETDWKLFRDSVYRRANYLIDTGIWEGIKKDRLNNWINCFDTYSCHTLPFLLLDTLIYRSKEQFHAMLWQLFTESVLPDAEGSRCLGSRLIEKFKARNEPGVRIAPVIGRNSPPTKSGPYILRLAARLFSLRSEWMIWPFFENVNTLTSKVHQLILLDDFCGTGTQFCEFLETTLQITELIRKRPELEIVYMVTTIHEDGLKKIKTSYPSVKVLYADLLNHDHGFFSEKNLSRYGTNGMVDYVSDLHTDLIKRVGLERPTERLRNFTALQLCYGFHHATPNNTLPIFWYQTSLWTPLLVR